jgi:competence protein ComEC
MRLPAVAIAALFAGGIALGLRPAISQHANSRLFLATCFGITAALVVFGFFLSSYKRLFPAAIDSALAWVMLGVLAACIASQPRSAMHVSSLVASGRIALGTPLRWHGRLRDEPAKLPWGYGYEIALSGVDSQDAFLPVTGGLRVSFTTRPDQPLPPNVHAGDEISVVTQAKLPQVFRDDGAFDRRAYLAQQGVDLTATLRAPELFERVDSPPPTVRTQLARIRRYLREEIDIIFAEKPEAAGLLRAILLGDRSFVDSSEATDFQKAGIFHVLVVAGLHVGAIAVLLFWIGRKLRLSPSITILFTLALLFCYVAIVEQRPPVLRAALMTALVVLGGFLFRRLELLNSAALAALLLLVAKPTAMADSSFQLTFLAIACIAGIAAPWLDRTLEPYLRALRGWRDVARDASHEPRAAQFRMDLRTVARWMSQQTPARIGKLAETIVPAGLALAFRTCELLTITIVLQIGMLPLMAGNFHRITLAAPVANLVAVPLLGFLVPMGFFALLCGTVFPALGKLIGIPIGWMTLLLVRLAQWFAHLPRWSYRIPGPPRWISLAFFLTVILACISLRLSNRWRKWSFRVCVAAMSAAAMSIAIFPFAPKWNSGKLEVTVLDVGQGDSLFVVSPGGKTMLIDGGGAFGGFPGHEEHAGIDPGEEAVSPYLWSRGFQKLDVVALTHAHQDHLGGLTAILENFHVGKLWLGREVSSAALARLEAAARQRRIPIEYELKGQTFSWDGVEGEFLWPENALDNVAPEAKNNDSLVLRLHFGERTLLLPGDAEKQTERQILSENAARVMYADVLKIGHHGSKNSTTPEFLAQVRPQIGVISSGQDNPYGHPSPELLERLENAGVRILRTDRDGAVHILTDGKNLEIFCYAACPQSSSSARSPQPQIPDKEQHPQ